MEPNISDILAFLEGNERRNLFLVSRGWRESIQDNERRMLEALYKKYPSYTTYGSIISAIQTGDVSLVGSMILTYISYLPLSWENVMRRMLMRDIPVTAQTKEIARLLFDKVSSEEDLSQSTIDILRRFSFKFETPEKIKRMKEIDFDLLWNYYRENDEYARYSPNVDLIIGNRLETVDILPEELLQLLSWSLSFGRDDILSSLYEKDPETVQLYIESLIENENPSCLYPKETREFLREISISCVPLSEETLSPDLYKTDDIENITLYGYLPIPSKVYPETLDILEENLDALRIFLSHRENIEIAISGEYSYISPEVYDIMLASLTPEDPLFRRVLSSAVSTGSPEVLEKYGPLLERS